MRRFTAATLVAAAAISLPVCAGSSRLEELAANLDEKIATLTNLVLRERISRYSQTGNKVCRLDSFDAVVIVADGTEQYSEVRRKNRLYSHVSQIDGLWSFGETITMLRTTREALHDTIPAADEVTYHYSVNDRRWFVMVGSRTYWLEFEGSVRMCPGTGDIQRIVWTSAPLPAETGIAGITWTVEFQSVEIAGRRCSVPKTGLYRITRTGSGNRAEWNVTEFSPQGLYGSESVIRFER